MLVISLLVLTLSGPVRGDDDTAVFFSGTLELATSFSGGEGDAFYFNVRGDSPFDNVKLRLFADVAITPRLSVLNQILIDPTAFFDVRSFLRTYLRYRVVESEGYDFYLQAGKIPTPFGTFGERAYTEENPLMATPLMYHYFSSVRTNQLPADNRDLLDHQGQGQLADYTGFMGGGSFIPHNGLPMVYDNCWDVGFAGVGSVGRLEYVVAVTQGTVSAPRFDGGDDNDGQQVAFHLGYVPHHSLRLGTSYARGPYLGEDVKPVIEQQGAELEDFEQEIWGFDLEYSVGRLRVIGEAAANRWQAPTVRDAAGRREDLKNVGWYLEAKYTVLAGLFVAARYGEVSFGNIDDGTGTGSRTPWDADVQRLEVGLGYHFNHRFMTKAAWQENRRSAPVSLDEGFGGLQLIVTF